MLVEEEAVGYAVLCVLGPRGSIRGCGRACSSPNFSASTEHDYSTVSTGHKSGITGINCSIASIIATCHVIIHNAQHQKIKQNRLSKCAKSFHQLLQPVPLGLTPWFG